MRGTVVLLLFVRFVNGITPAHAGNSKGPQVQTVVFEDHPRSCGEQYVLNGSPIPGKGSPPLMRGTGADLLEGTEWHRITPAHAGNSGHYLAKLQQFWDHPRSCGEQCFLPFVIVYILGSPPLMRGTELHKCLDLFKSRITPAHAGNSRNISFRERNIGDHPRSCGEQSPPIVVTLSVRGSPPLMRGTVGQYDVCGFSVRITPAHAGNSDTYFAG